MSERQKTVFFIFGAIVLGCLVMAIFDGTIYLFSAALYAIWGLIFFVKITKIERNIYSKKENIREPEDDTYIEDTIEKETVTITCFNCGNRSNIEVQLVDPDLYWGVCPKCITEDSHCDIFIGKYQMEEFKEKGIDNFIQATFSCLNK